MSKKNYHNYNNYSKATPKQEAPVEPVIEKVEEEIVNIVEEVIAPEAQEETNSVKGIITNCTKLNIRETPDSDAKVVCVVSEKTSVEIDMNASTKVFYKVFLASGVEGFCMKKFVKMEE